MKKLKCSVCENEFEPVVEDHYVSRNDCSTGIANAIRSDEPTLYDTFDCPKCGCQCCVQERKRACQETIQLEKDNEDKNEIT